MLSAPLLGFDCETWLIAPCCVAPPLVCLTWAMQTGQGLRAALVTRTGESTDGGVWPVPEMIGQWLGPPPPMKGGWGVTSVRPEPPPIHIVGHNVAFDFAVVTAEHPELMPQVWEAYAQGRIHDTMIREKLRDIAFGDFRWIHNADGTTEKKNYGLADLVRTRLGKYQAKTKISKKGQIEGEDTWRLRYRELHNVRLRYWPKEAITYPLGDATYPLEIFAKQEYERDQVYAQRKMDVLCDEPAQVRAAWWMQLMSCQGMPLDVTRVDALEKAITEERVELEEILIDEGLVRVEQKRNGTITKTRDTKAAQQYMIDTCADLGIPVKMTKGGTKERKDGTFSPPSVCLDAEACEDTGDEILIAYAQYTALGNVLGKDVKAMRGVPRIHSGFDTLVASGRTSSRKIAGVNGKGAGMNIQNLRRDGKTRECFVAPEGFSFCMIDLTAAELYAVAQICIWMFGYSRLAEVLRSTGKNGKAIDPHVYLASKIMRRDYDEVIAIYENKQHPEQAFVKQLRQVCKNANYGLWGGMGAKRFVTLVKRQSSGKGKKPILLPLDFKDEVPGGLPSAARLRQEWLATWPEAKLYLDYFGRLCAHGQTATVKQWRSGRIRGGLRFSEACNTGFQGLIADIMKEAGFLVSREMYDITRQSVLFGSRLVNFPHDELIALVRKMVNHECAMRIEKIVQETIARWCPDVRAPAESYLADFWSKEAERVVNENGRIIPWKGKKEKKAA